MAVRRYEAGSRAYQAEGLPGSTRSSYRRRGARRRSSKESEKGGAPLSEVFKKEAVCSARRRKNPNEGERDSRD